MPRANFGELATYDPLQQMQRRLNQEFDNFWRGGQLTNWGSGVGSSGSLFPAMDVHDSGDKLCVQCELPGMKKEDVNIELQDNLLTISGKREGGSKHEGHNWISQERHFGSFSRSISVPEGVSPQDISAHFGDGVLELTVNKPTTPNRHRIELK